MDPLTIGAIIGGAQGVGQLVTGIVQKSKAAKMARKNPRPKYEIQKEILDNQNLTESKASEGLSDAAKQVYSTGAERGLSSSINAILKGGGSVNNIADIYDTYQGGISKLALIDEEMRARNIQNMINQNNVLASEKDKQWQVNVFAPYADKAQAAAALSKQGMDNIWKGVNTMTGAATNYLMGQQYAKEGANVFGGTGSGSNGSGQIMPQTSSMPQTTQSGTPLNAGQNWNIGNSGLSAGQILQAMPRRNSGSGIGGLDPLIIDGVAYDPLTMQPL